MAVLQSTLNFLFSCNAGVERGAVRLLGRFQKYWFLFAVTFLPTVIDKKKQH